MEKEKLNTSINRERRESPDSERACREVESWEVERREEGDEEEEGKHSAGTLPGALRLEAMGSATTHGDTKSAGLGISTARLLYHVVIQIPAIIITIIILKGNITVTT